MAATESTPRRFDADLEPRARRVGFEPTESRPGWDRATVAERALSVAGLTLLAAFAIAIDLHYGRRGFLPIDQATVFDGGWRTLSGQVPFREYTTPNAIVPSLLQGLWFWALGVTWTTYLLHAAVFNALFALTVYTLLRLCDGNRTLSLFYAALSAVVFYPPIGVPFHDQHSFFFTLLAITLAVAATRAVTASAARAFWVAIPFALTAAALSKQTPVLLGTPVVLALAFAGRERITRVASWLGAGAVGAIGLVLSAAVLAGVDWGLVRTYFLELPLETGGSRAGRAAGTSLSLVALAAFFALIVVGPSAILQREGRRRFSLARDARLPLFLSVAFLLLCAAFTALTLNEPAEGVPLFFVSFGLFHLAIGRALRQHTISVALRLPVLVASTIVVLSLVAAWTFNDAVNARRGTLTLDYDAATVETGGPAGLSFMKFQPSSAYLGLRASDLKRLVDHLRARDGSFVLFGDTTVINGLSGKPSVFPALFVTRGLTYPRLGDPELREFEARLVARMIESDVRRVVLENRTSAFAEQFGAPTDLPALQGILRRCGKATREFGFFSVVEISPRRECPWTLSSPD